MEDATGLDCLRQIVGSIVTTTYTYMYVGFARMYCLDLFNFHLRPFAFTHFGRGIVSWMGWIGQGSRVCLGIACLAGPFFYDDGQGRE
jgi:hypothetical protein